jgi:hypothetical protein
MAMRGDEEAAEQIAKYVDDVAKMTVERGTCRSAATFDEAKLAARTESSWMATARP